MSVSKLGTNMTVSVEGNILKIEINLQERHGASGSGKSDLVASTHGPVEIPGYPGVKLGLNAFSPHRKG